MTNYGYSDYFKASVFDGKGWRNLELRGFIPESARHYATQSESGAVRERLVAAVESLCLRIASRVSLRTYFAVFANSADCSLTTASTTSP